MGPPVQAPCGAEGGRGAGGRAGSQARSRGSPCTASAQCRALPAEARTSCSRDSRVPAPNPSPYP